MSTAYHTPARTLRVAIESMAAAGKTVPQIVAKLNCDPQLAARHAAGIRSVHLVSGDWSAENAAHVAAVLASSPRGFPFYDLRAHYRVAA